MNSGHSKLSDWGLTHVSAGKGYAVLDHSADRVAATKRTNARSVRTGRVEVRQGSVSPLPFPECLFDLITAVETHFCRPDLTADMCQTLRVLKPGGKLLIGRKSTKERTLKWPSS
jgi:SAM-dependent methyltransferase